VADEFGVPRALSDYHELVSLPEVDLVSVSAPPEMHHAMTMAAIAAGKHVLCEKPMALNAAEAREMATAAETAGVVNAINHEMRYGPVRRRIKELVDEGFLGKVQVVSLTVNNPYGVDPGMEPYYYGWLSSKARGCGFLNGVISHQVDALRHWFGDIAHVSGRATNLQPMRPVLTFDYRDGDPIGPDTPTVGERAVETDDAAMVSGTFANGGLFSLIGTWNAHHGAGTRLEAYGDRGSLVLDGNGKLFGGRSGEGGLVEIEIPARLEPPIAGNAGAMTLLALDLARAIKSLATPGWKPAYATFRDGVRVQEVIDAVLANG
jgi:predicted dehydrogenase